MKIVDPDLKSIAGPYYKEFDLEEIIYTISKTFKIKDQDYMIKN